MQAVFEQFRFGSSTSGPLVRDHFAFSELLEFALQMRREHQEVAALLLKREWREPRWFITLVLLDGQDGSMQIGNGLLGHTMLVKFLDGELSDVFDGAERAVVAIPSRTDNKPTVTE